MSTSQKTAEGASTQTFLSSLITNSVVALIELIAFILLKNKFRKVYSPRSYLPPANERSDPLGRGVFGWIPTVIRADPEQIMHKNGLDAYYFLRFLSLMLKIFIPFTVISWAVLFPVYSAKPVTGLTGLDQFTYGNVSPTQQSRLAAPCALIWVLNIWIFFLIRREIIHFIRKRQRYLLSPHHASLPQSKTVLVTGVPPPMLVEENIRTFASYLPGGAKQIWMCRDLRKLPDMYDRRLSAFKKLEAAETHLAKLVTMAKARAKQSKGKTARVGPDIEGNKGWEEYAPEKKRAHHRLGPLSFLGIGRNVDTINWAKHELRTLTSEIDEARDQLGDYPVHNSVFIEFNTQIAAHMFAQSLSHHVPLAMTGRWIEVSPEDVIWFNLNIPPLQARFRMVISLTLTAALILFWAIPVAFVGTISNITGLCSSVSWMAWLCKLPDPVPGIIQGILPPVLLTVLFLLVPMILRLLIIFEGDPLHSLVDLKLMKRYFVFLVIHGFLVVTLSSGLTTAIPLITKDPSSALTLLAQNLPRASTFFLTYIMTTMLAGAAGSLLQIASLAIYYVKMFLMATTPRQIFKIRYTMGYVTWGTDFPKVTLLVVISLSYAVVSPLVNGLACVGFALYWFVYKYLFIFVYDTPHAGETGGLFFPMAIDHAFVGLYVQQVFLATLFFFAQDSNQNQSGLIPGALTIVLIVVTFLFHALLRSSFYPLVQYLPISLAPHIDAIRSHRQRVPPKKAPGANPHAGPDLAQPGQHGELNEKSGEGTELPEVISDAGPNYSQSSRTHGEVDEKAGDEVELTRIHSHDASTGAHHHHHMLHTSHHGHKVAEGTDVPRTNPDVGAHDLQLQGKPVVQGDEPEHVIRQAPHAFHHPATWENLPPVWVPSDAYGVIKSELTDLQKFQIEASVDGAMMDEKGKVTITRNPPGSRRVFHIPPTD